MLIIVEIYVEFDDVLTCNCCCQASTVERIMKNLRIEITQLRRSLEESRYPISRLITQYRKKRIQKNVL